MELAFKSASDLAEQLITLSTSILALTITFSKDVLKEVQNKFIRNLKISWLCYLFCIILGIWTLMAITGTMAAINQQQIFIDFNVRIPAALQIISFITGTIFVIRYGVMSLNKRKE